MSTYGRSVGAGAQPAGMNHGHGLRRWGAILCLAAALVGLPLAVTRPGYSAGLGDAIVAHLQVDGLQGGSCG